MQALFRFKVPLTEYYYVHRGTLELCAWWGSQQRAGAWNREMNITNFCVVFGHQASVEMQEMAQTVKFRG